MSGRSNSAVAPSKRRDSWTERLRQNEAQLTLVLSLVIGALVGLVVVAFLLLTGRLADQMYPAGGAGWRRFLVPTLGALVTGYFLARFFPSARGSGIPQTKSAITTEEGYISLRTVAGKFACCSASLASGIALGREGPSVHVGAGLASVMARGLGLSAERVKSLVPVGCAAALAAAFNTPIAAILFSLEEIMGDLHAPILGGVVLSSATAWMVLHLLLGDEPLFHVPGYHLVHPAEFAVYAVLGVVGGLGSVAFVKLLLGLRARFLGLRGRFAWMSPVVGGLTVGAIGWVVPDVLGVGYNYVERVLNGDVVLQAVAMLAVLKLVATAVCYASGNAGGIFGPSLFIGATIGAAVGSVAHALFPAFTAEPGAYALIGMGTAFAGIIRTPLTSVIMIFEVTRDYTIIVPVMISNLIAFYVSHRLQRVPIYEALSLQDGVHLPTEESRSRPGQARVFQAMRPVTLLITGDTPLAAAWEQVKDTRFEAVPVADRHGFHHMVARSDIQTAAADGRGDEPASSLLGPTAPTVTRVFPHLHPDHTLGIALERMGASAHKVLPVVSRANVRRLLGIVTLDDVLSTYGVVERAEPRAAQVVSTRSYSPVEGPLLLRTIVLIGVALVGLAVVDTVLAREDREARRAEAARYFDAGEQLAASGRPNEAAASFQAALTIRRDERPYQLALGDALLAAGRLDDAEDVLQRVFASDSTDARANLIMARVLAARHDWEGASRYYHRAIYGGRWTTDAAAERLDVRLELIRLLVRHGPRQELLAELLSLQARTGLDPDTQREVGRLYLTAGAPNRAAEVFAALLERAPTDAEAHVGAGEAALQNGDYLAARTHLRTAQRLGVDSDDVRARLEICDAAMALDPTRRGLAGAERYRRTQRLIALLLERRAACPAAGVSAQGDLVARAQAVVDTPRAERRDGAPIESNLDLAELLWREVAPVCPAATSPSQRALGILLQRLLR